MGKVRGDENWRLFDENLTRRRYGGGDLERVDAGFNFLYICGEFETEARSDTSVLIFGKFKFLNNVWKNIDLR